MLYYGNDGKTYNTTKLIGKGGEGEVFDIVEDPDKVIKIFKKTSLEMALTKDFQWSEFVSNNTMFPLAALYTNRACTGECVGYVMRRLKSQEMLLDVYNHPDNMISIYNQACIAMNISRLVKEIHYIGYSEGRYNVVIGDFNQKNIFVDRRTGNVQLTDADSFHVNVKYRGKL